MHKDNHHSPAAIAYAQALLDLATDSGAADSTAQELRDLRQAMDTNPKFADVLDNPAISKKEHSDLIDRVFGGNRASKLLVNFLQLANLKGRLGLLSSIIGAYEELLDQKKGVVETDVTVAEKMTPAQLEAVRQKVGAALKREAIVHQYVDPTIIGGLILRVQDQLIDGSVRAQLTAMRRSLLAARP